jgi:hypothetical protein
MAQGTEVNRACVLAGDPFGSPKRPALRVSSTPAATSLVLCGQVPVQPSSYGCLLERTEAALLRVANPLRMDARAVCGGGGGAGCGDGGGH